MANNVEDKLQELAKQIRSAKKAILEKYLGHPIPEEEVANMELPDEVLESLGNL